MASVLGLPAGAAFAPQNLDAPVPSTTAAQASAMPPPAPSASAKAGHPRTPAANKRTRALKGKSPKGRR
jgi:hypothetical protein